MISRNMTLLLGVMLGLALEGCGGPDRLKFLSADDGNGGDQDQDENVSGDIEGEEIPGDTDETELPPETAPPPETASPPGTAPGSTTPPPLLSTCRAKGFNYPCWYPGCYQEEEVPSSLAFAESVGADWLAIVPTWYQETTRSNTISEHPTRSPTTDDLRTIISLAHEEGFKILLKPHIDILDGSWRGDIAPSTLAAWQAAYEEFILHFADLGEELGVETLSIGTELKTRSGDTPFWSNLTASIRDHFSGELTYSANWDEYASVGFWSGLDSIGIDFYHPLTDNPQATIDEMIDGLDPVIEEIQAFSVTAGKPVLFTEIGYRSIDGTNTRPYDFTMTGATDAGEQADAYRAALTVLQDEEWLDGIFWWRLDPRLTPDEDDYSIYGKTAEGVLEEFWGDEACPGSSAPEAPPDTPSSTGSKISFIAFGDWGTGGDEQLEVAQAMGNYCAVEDCDFVVTLGDNFYSNGVESVTDEQWQEKYTDVYGSLGLPFYASLGNHDNNGNIQAQIDYSEIDPTWHMPAEHYSFVVKQGGVPVVEFFVFNSDYPHFRGASVQDWMDDAIAASTAPWKLVAMHHPVYSNGNHGSDDQGNNEFLLPIICNRTDLVLSGHDHSFEHLRSSEDGCPIEQLVIGTGGASIRTVTPDSRTLSFALVHGFGWFEATANRILFRMIDTNGAVLYSTSWEK